MGLVFLILRVGELPYKHERQDLSPTWFQCLPIMAALSLYSIPCSHTYTHNSCLLKGVSGSLKGERGGGLPAKLFFQPKSSEAISPEFCPSGLQIILQSSVSNVLRLDLKPVIGTSKS